MNIENIREGFKKKNELERIEESASHVDKSWDQEGNIIAEFRYKDDNGCDRFGDITLKQPENGILFALVSQRLRKEIEKIKKEIADL